MCSHIFGRLPLCSTTSTVRARFKFSFFKFSFWEAVFGLNKETAKGVLTFFQSSLITNFLNLFDPQPWTAHKCSLKFAYTYCTHVTHHAEMIIGENWSYIKKQVWTIYFACTDRTLLIREGQSACNIFMRPRPDFVFGLLHTVE